MFSGETKSEMFIRTSLNTFASITFTSVYISTAPKDYSDARRKTKWSQHKCIRQHCENVVKKKRSHNYYVLWYEIITTGQFPHQLYPFIAQLNPQISYDPWSLNNKWISVLGTFWPICGILFKIFNTPPPPGFYMPRLPRLWPIQASKYLWKCLNKK